MICVIESLVISIIFILLNVSHCIYFQGTLHLLSLHLLINDISVNDSTRRASRLKSTLVLFFRHEFSYIFTVFVLVFHLVILAISILWRSVLLLLSGFALTMLLLWLHISFKILIIINVIIRFEHHHQSWDNYY